MKYYSELLNKMFNSDTECANAEAEYQVKKAAEEEKKKAAAKEKESRRAVCMAAFEAYRKAQKDYDTVCAQFRKDYGHNWSIGEKALNNKTNPKDATSSATATSPSYHEISDNIDRFLNILLNSIEE